MVQSCQLARAFSVGFGHGFRKNCRASIGLDAGVKSRILGSNRAFAIAGIKQTEHLA